MAQRMRSHAGTPQRRDQIFQAALECFSEHGFAATTLEQIRARSGASTGSIYHHFRNKEQLAIALYLEGLRDYHDDLLKVLEGYGRTAEALIRRSVEHHLAWTARHPEWARYLHCMRQTEIISSSEAQIRALNQTFSEQVAPYFEPHFKSGRIRRLPRDVMHAVLVGPVHEFERQWLGGRTRTDIKEAGHLLSARVWECLRGPFPRTRGNTNGKSI